jgi:hypothetical protein
VEHFHWLHAIITLAGLMCLGAIWHERTKERLSRRATLLLITLGPFSWGLQMWLLSHIDLTDPALTTYLFWCTLAAIICFFLVIFMNLSKRVHGRDVAQALTWGQFVFPLVLVSFLPDGMMTFLALVL